MALDIDSLRSWIGRTEILQDTVTCAPLCALSATLDRHDLSDAQGGVVHPAWHWLYFLPMARASEIGADGHPRRGGFLPPVELPRRMWAGSRMQFLAPLRAGQALVRRSHIEDIKVKDGRSGPLVFVQLRHEIVGDGKLSIVEEQDIVYRDLPPVGQGAPSGAAAPADAQWSRRVEPDAVLLFRYSALTFNGHRIHYDRQYVTQVEGYPGLIVHGPLIATLLLDLLRRHRPDAQVRTFRFRAVRPLFDTAAFFVCGCQDDAETVRLWARTEDGELAMDATATLY